MTSYTQVFGGTTIYPSDVSLLALALSADTTLDWPLESPGGSNIASRIIDVTPSAGGFSVTMPDATETGIGQTILFNNLSGSYSFYVKDYAGNTIATVAFGEQWQIYLAGVSTAAGTWRVFRYGASTASVQASALAGYGVTVTGSTLSTNEPVVTFSASTSVGVVNRASAFVWTGSGSGTLSLLSAVTAGNGFAVSVRNEGGGDLTVDPDGSETVNSVATLVLSPGDSATLITNGTAWYTLGFGKDADFAFDYTSIAVGAPATDPYTLSGAELNRIAYEFTGVLTTDMDIVVPPTVQQYWVNNATTGSFALGLRTATQVTPVTVPQGFQCILYCDASNVVQAAANTGAAPSVQPVSGGGTGITSYAVGDLLYASASNVLSKLADVATGNALISGGVATAASWGKIGLATHVSGTLAVANGGTGAGNLTGYLLGNGTSAVTAATTIPIGSVSGLGSGVGTFLATPSSANLAAALTDETGTGASVFATSPTLVTPVLGTPASGNLTNCTAIPLGSVAGTLAVANGGTGAATLTGLVVGNGTSAFTVVTAPSGAVVGTTDTQTLTNKRTTPRVSSTASITSPLAWNSDNYDQYAATAQAGALTINADAGTPTDGQKMMFRITDNGTSRALTWTTGSSKSFRAVGVTLPTATTISKTVYVGCIYNSAASRWDAVGVAQEA